MCVDNWLPCATAEHYWKACCECIEKAMEIVFVAVKSESNTILASSPVLFVPISDDLLRRMFRKPFHFKGGCAQVLMVLVWLRQNCVLEQCVA